MKRGSHLIVPVLVLGACLWVFGGAEIADRLLQAQLEWVALAIACLFAQTVLMAWRWRLVALGHGLSFSFPWALREYLVAQLVNMTLPGGVVGDAARAFRSRSEEAGVKPAAVAVVVERSFGQAGVFAVAYMAVLWTVLSPSTLPAALIMPLALGATLALVVAGVAGVYLRGGRIARILARSLPNRRQKMGQFALAIDAALLNIAAFAASAQAVGAPIPLQEALVIIPLILTAMLIPLSVGGWGWREGAAAALFPLAGLPAAAGVAAGIVYGGTMILAVLPVLPLLLRDPERWTQATPR